MFGRAYNLKGVKGKISESQGDGVTLGESIGGVRVLWMGHG